MLHSARCKVECKKCHSQMAGAATTSGWRDMHQTDLRKYKTDFRIYCETCRKKTKHKLIPE